MGKARFNHQQLCTLIFPISTFPLLLCFKVSQSGMLAHIVEFYEPLIQLFALIYIC